jgi:hypothetical protein
LQIYLYRLKYNILPLHVQYKYKNVPLQYKRNVCEKRHDSYGNTHTGKASKEGCCTKMSCGTTHEVHISTRKLVSFFLIYLFANRKCAPLKILTVPPCTVSIQGIYDRLALKILNAAFPQEWCFTQSICSLEHRMFQTVRDFIRFQRLHVFSASFAAIPAG